MPDSVHNYASCDRTKVRINKIIVCLLPLILAHTVLKDNRKVVTGASVHWIYSSSCSSAISALEPHSSKHSRSSISSVVELARPMYDCNHNISCMHYETNHMTTVMGQVGIKKS